MPFSISLADIQAAAGRIQDHAVQTPVMTSAVLDVAVGARVFLKPENLQRTGSFKFRGALNRLLQLSAEERRAGVVAWSSGNHAQGIAAAAQILGIPATIVMPKDAPAVKVEKTRGYGAEVIGYDRYTESREEIGHRLSKERGWVLVPSYDDSHIIAGQGTAGLELVKQMTARGEALDVLLVCCGGGGLIAGMSTAFKALSPKTEVYSVEPAEFNDHERSLQSGQREANDPGARSFCDALLAPTPGSLTFDINQHTLVGGLSVTDAQVKEAMRFAFDSLKLVVEPGGAVALAAALSSKLDLARRSVGVVLSGGNVDPGLIAEVVSAQGRPL
ncbi:MAG: threonine/serine dehydratase [Pseudomonadota bacterium]